MQIRDGLEVSAEIPLRKPNQRLGTNPLADTWNSSVPVCTSEQATVRGI